MIYYLMVIINRAYQSTSFTDYYLMMIINNLAEWCHEKKAVIHPGMD